MVKKKDKIKGKEKETEKREKILISVFTVLLVSLMITFIVLNTEEIMQITGYASSGQINLTITQNLSINVIVANMSFGEGKVIIPNDHATINSSTNLGTGVQITTAMLEAANWSNETAYDPSRILIENEGNVNGSVTITSGSTPVEFLGGTGADYEYNASNALANSCVSGATLQDWTTFTGASQTVCTNLGSTDGMDQLYIDARLTIPYNSVGAKEDFWTFGATAVT